ncbi:unnamed protein product [Arctia plantaginis]|uniref:Luciferin 4-monooxygenase n=1 Tax=Arctia plantaginis TaxID=874455 RepID=A0A8S0YLV7_ARCPL|nr:unnamed protein product [Arctia plantaginis]
MKPFEVTNEKYHLGHLFRDIMNRDPSAICQIDAATGERETNATVLRRSVQLARCLRRYGTQPGDVLALGSYNHLDVHIPLYAAVMNGMPVTGVEFGSTPAIGFPYEYIDIKQHFKVCSPKIAFCQKDYFDDNLRAIKELGLDTKLICFDHEDYSMKKFIEEYDDDGDEEFEPSEFDLDKIYAGLVATGGTTGILKLAAFKHKVVVNRIYEMKNNPFYQAKEGERQKLSLVLSPVNWISMFLRSISLPYTNYIKLTTSAPPTTDHVIDIINKYKPAVSLIWPPLAVSLIACKKECDFTCFDSITLVAGKTAQNIHLELKKKLRPDAKISEGYGQTENLGFIVMPNPSGALGNCGKETIKGQSIKLVDPDTGKEVTEPNVSGELWVKNVCFSEYFNNPEETARAFSVNGWYKTGDLLYRDEEGSYFFVERLKMIIKYLNYHIFPEDLEKVIAEHPGVADVSVTCIPHNEDQEHPVACVVRKNGATVTAQQIKNLVANKLADYQKLRGGVIFMDKITLTSTGKVARGKLKQMALTAHRE